MMDRLEVKFDAGTGEAGLIEGYGSIFGNVDQGGDMILRGAFRDSLKEWKRAKKLPAMLVQHGGGFSDMDGIPVGIWDDMEEDERGLRVKGRLINLDTERGKTIYGAVGAGVLDGLSIGYRAKEFAWGTKPGEPQRTLKKVELVEVSIVTFPMNKDARVTSVKAADLSEREIERKLTRDAGFTRSEAQTLMRGGLTALKAMRDAGGELHELAQFMRNPS
jgi:uncharacterized protein